RGGPVSQSRTSAARPTDGWRHPGPSHGNVSDIMLNIDVPFHIDGRGRTALTDDARHLRDLLELLLFTNPGERVNRPAFGGGVRALVFAGNGPELAGALRFNLQANLQRWLGDLLEIVELATAAEEAVLRVDLQYRVRGKPEVQTAQFQRQV